ncbi:MAG TPA: hypothetical protein VJB97_02605 [Candidatus Paceibacterota bacterium]
MSTRFPYAPRKAGTLHNTFPPGGRFGGPSVGERKAERRAADPGSIEEKPETLDEPPQTK